jgi:hypothetical protein
VTVSGTISAGTGATGGTAGTGPSAVTAVSVNGVAATLTGATFTATGVPLIEGGNTLTATATDAQGHVGIASINVVRDLTPPHVAIYTPAAGARLAASSVAVTGLVNDIVAGTVNAANATVTVNGIPATVANRSFVVPSVPLQRGQNVLTAVAVDAAGNQAQATVTVNQATPAGPHLAVASGSGQSAPIGTPLPQPLVAVLLDPSGQPIAGAQVLFQALATDGTFDNGRRAYAVTTDLSGQATVRFTVGTHAGAGNQLVQASAPGTAGPVQFIASAQPGPPALLVVDAGNQQQGVAGQALPLPLVAVVVDAGGNRLPGIAATFNVVKGAGTFANGQPTLLPLDLENGVAVDETHGGTLTLPQVPGFSLKILPGSVTFPGGGRSGTVSVTVVHSDKVPMVPNFGQQPRLIVTIQPAGAQFNPPATITLPNVEGFAVGRTAEIYSSTTISAISSASGRER